MMVSHPYLHKMGHVANDILWFNGYIQVLYTLNVLTNHYHCYTSITIK